MRTCVWLLLAVALHATAADGVPNAPPAITRDMLDFRRALALKTAADEEFIFSDYAAARELYGEAALVLNQLSRNGKTTPLRQVALLNAEIEYRSLLLEHGLSFWGAATSLTPQSPVTNLVRMRQLVEKFETLNGDVDRLLQIVLAEAGEEQRLRVAEEQLNTTIKVEMIRQQRVEVAEDYHEKRASAARDRLRIIIVRQQDLQQEADAKLAQLHALQKQANGLILSGISKAAGLPVDLSAVANGQSLDQAITGAATTMLADASSPLSKHLGELGETTKHITDAYRQASEVKQRIDDGLQTLQQIDSLVREPTFEKLLRVGGDIYATLPEQQRAEWRALAESAKPVVVLVDLAREPGAVRTVVTRLIAANIPDDTKFAAIATQALKGRDAAAWYGDTVRRLSADANLTIAQQRAIVDSVARTSAAAVIARLNPDARGLLMKSFGATSEQELVAKVTNTGMSAIPDVSVTGMQITISGQGVQQQISLAELASLPTPENVATAADRLDAEVVKLGASLGAKRADLIAAVVDQLPFPAIEQQLARTLPAGGGEAYDALMARLDPSARAAALEHAAQVTVGARVAERSNALDAAANINATPPQSPAAGAQSADVLQSIVTGGLTALVPAAGLAQIGMQVIDSLNQMGELEAQLRSIADESRSLLTEELHLHEAVDESRFNHALAVLERRMAEAAASGAMEELRLQRDAIREAVRTNDVARRKILTRKPLAFFYAEQLRASYDGLDRSVALWLGSASENRIRGFIAEKVRNDPQMVRYFLDDDIHLAEWLDPTPEGRRDNIDALAVHWRKRYELVADLCARIGCSPDNAVLGEIQQTGPILLSKLLTSNDRKRLKEWQANPTGEISFTALVHPGLNVIPGRRDNVRLVDVRVRGVQGTTRVPLTQFRLSHPGVAYVPHRGRFVRDIQKPDAIEASASSEFDLDALRNRWNPAAAVARKRLEGYGLYTLWTLTLDADATNRELADVEFNFAYQFLDQNDPVEERHVIATMELARGFPITLDPNAIETFGSAEELKAKIRRFSERDPLDGLPPLSHRIVDVREEGQ